MIKTKWIKVDLLKLLIISHKKGIYIEVLKAHPKNGPLISKGHKTKLYMFLVHIDLPWLSLSVP